MKKLKIPEYGFLRGDIVYVTAGKGEGCIFVVTDVRDNFCMLVDGSRRRFDNAKCKKWKHMRLMHRPSDGLVPGTDQAIRKLLAQYADAYHGRQATQQQHNYTE